MRKNKFFALAFIASLLLIGSLNALVLAQNNATVIIANSTGGSTDPGAGTTTYADGTAVTITATPGDGYGFLMWLVTTSQGSSNFLDNPLVLTVAGGTTYTVQANFQTIQPIRPNDTAVDYSSAAIVIVLAGAGGTTSPAPGTYALANATSTQLFATPNNGWTFEHWVISGTPSSHGGYPVNYTPTDNPYTVGHGYGYTYYYQPVFTPTGSSTGGTPTPTATATATPGTTLGGLTTDNWIFIGLIVIIVILLIALVFSFSRRRK